MMRNSPSGNRSVTPNSTKAAAHDYRCQFSLERYYTENMCLKQELLEQSREAKRYRCRVKILERDTATQIRWMEQWEERLLKSFELKDSSSKFLEFARQAVCETKRTRVALFSLRATEETLRKKDKLLENRRLECERCGVLEVELEKVKSKRRPNTHERKAASRARSASPTKVFAKRNAVPDKDQWRKICKEQQELLLKVEKDLQGAKRTNQTLAAELETLRKMGRDHTEPWERVCSALDNVKCVIRQKERDGKEKHLEIERLDSQLATAEDKGNQARAELLGAKSEIADLKARLSTLECNLTKQSRLTDTAGLRNADLTRELHADKETVAQLTAQVDTLDRQLSEQTSALRAAETTVSAQHLRLQGVTAWSMENYEEERQLKLHAVEDAIKLHSQIKRLAERNAVLENAIGAITKRMSQKMSDEAKRFRRILLMLRVQIVSERNSYRILVKETDDERSQTKLKIDVLEEAVNGIQTVEEITPAFYPFLHKLLAAVEPQQISRKELTDAALRVREGTKIREHLLEVAQRPRWGRITIVDVKAATVVRPRISIGRELSGWLEPIGGVFEVLLKNDEPLVSVELEGFPQCHLAVQWKENEIVSVEHHMVEVNLLMEVVDRPLSEQWVLEVHIESIQLEPNHALAYRCRGMELPWMPPAKHELIKTEFHGPQYAGWTKPTTKRQEVYCGDFFLLPYAPTRSRVASFDLMDNNVAVATALLRDGKGLRTAKLTGGAGVVRFTMRAIKFCEFARSTEVDWVRFSQVVLAPSATTAKVAKSYYARISSLAGGFDRFQGPFDVVATESEVLLGPIDLPAVSCCVELTDSLRGTISLEINPHQLVLPTTTIDFGHAQLTLQQDFWRMELIACPSPGVMYVRGGKTPAEPLHVVAGNYILDTVVPNCKFIVDYRNIRGKLFSYPINLPPCGTAGLFVPFNAPFGAFCMPVCSGEVWTLLWDSEKFTVFSLTLSRRLAPNVVIDTNQKDNACFLVHAFEGAEISVTLRDPLAASEDERCVVYGRLTPYVAKRGTITLRGDNCSMDMTLRTKTFWECASSQMSNTEQTEVASALLPDTTGDLLFDSANEAGDQLRTAAQREPQAYVDESPSTSEPGPPPRQAGVSPIVKVYPTEVPDHPLTDARESAGSVPSEEDIFSDEFDHQTAPSLSQRSAPPERPIVCDTEVLTQELHEPPADACLSVRDTSSDRDVTEPMISERSVLHEQHVDTAGVASAHSQCSGSVISQSRVFPYAGLEMMMGYLLEPTGSCALSKESAMDVMPGPVLAGESASSSNMSGEASPTVSSPTSTLHNDGSATGDGIQEERERAQREEILHYYAMQEGQSEINALQHAMSAHLTPYPSIRHARESTWSHAATTALLGSPAHSDALAQEGAADLPEIPSLKLPANHDSSPPAALPLSCAPLPHDGRMRKYSAVGSGTPPTERLTDRDLGDADETIGEDIFASATMEQDVISAYDNNSRELDTEVNDAQNMGTMNDKSIVDPSDDAAGENPDVGSGHLDVEEWREKANAGLGGTVADAGIEVTTRQDTIGADVVPEDGNAIVEEARDTGCSRGDDEQVVESLSVQVDQAEDVADQAMVGRQFIGDASTKPCTSGDIASYGELAAERAEEAQLADVAKGAGAEDAEDPTEMVESSGTADENAPYDPNAKSVEKLNEVDMNMMDGGSQVRVNDADIPQNIVTMDIAVIEDPHTNTSRFGGVEDALVEASSLTDQNADAAANATPGSPSITEDGASPQGQNMALEEPGSVNDIVPTVEGHGTNEALSMMRGTNVEPVFPMIGRKSPDADGTTDKSSVHSSDHTASISVSATRGAPTEAPNDHVGRTLADSFAYTPAVAHCGSDMTEKDAAYNTTFDRTSSPQATSCVQSNAHSDAPPSARSTTEPLCLSHAKEPDDSVKDDEYIRGSDSASPRVSHGNAAREESESKSACPPPGTETRQSVKEENNSSKRIDSTAAKDSGENTAYEKPPHKSSCFLPPAKTRTWSLLEDNYSERFESTSPNTSRGNTARRDSQSESVHALSGKEPTKSHEEDGSSERFESASPRDSLGFVGLEKQKPESPRFSRRTLSKEPAESMVKDDYSERFESASPIASRENTAREVPNDEPSRPPSVKELIMSGKEEAYSERFESPSPNVSRGNTARGEFKSESACSLRAKEPSESVNEKDSSKRCERTSPRGNGGKVTPSDENTATKVELEQKPHTAIIVGDYVATAMIQPEVESFASSNGPVRLLDATGVPEPEDDERTLAPLKIEGSHARARLVDSSPLPLYCVTTMRSPSSASDVFASTSTSPQNAALTRSTTVLYMPSPDSPLPTYASIGDHTPLLQDLAAQPPRRRLSRTSSLGSMAVNGIKYLRMRASQRVSKKKTIYE
eukprot:GEMP01000379.1.p1 GENE.GEMP01000379.1~~GEMP01000379.1.p1  ORF type:complete len:2378 (+),score=565.68 GEMP01000379.1:170-7303(+)